LHQDPADKQSNSPGTGSVLLTPNSSGGLGCKRQGPTTHHARKLARAQNGKGKSRPQWGQELCLHTFIHVHCALIYVEAILNVQLCFVSHIRLNEGVLVGVVKVCICAHAVACVRTLAHTHPVRGVDSYPRGLQQRETLSCNKLGICVLDDWNKKSRHRKLSRLTYPQKQLQKVGVQQGQELTSAASILQSATTRASVRDSQVLEVANNMPAVCTPLGALLLNDKQDFQCKNKKTPSCLKWLINF